MSFIRLSNAFLLFVLVTVNECLAGVTAEQILGEYWADPLFGEAAADISIDVEILSNRLWPPEVEIPEGKNIRFVFTNKSDQAHLLVFSDNVDALLSDPRFKNFAADELLHSKKKTVSNRGHSHESSSADDAQAIVKTLAQRPSVFIAAQGRKEILVNFSKQSNLSMFCALDKHHLVGYMAKINVVE